MKLIYIAGKYTAKTRVEVLANVQAARECAAVVVSVPGCFPMTPHFLSDGLDDLADYDYWCAGTLEVMLRCDAMILLPNWSESRGAREELRVMQDAGKPVFHSEGALRRWAKSGEVLR